MRGVETHNLGLLQSIWDRIHVDRAAQGLPRIEAIQLITKALGELCSQRLSEFGLCGLDFFVRMVVVRFFLLDMLGQAFKLLARGHHAVVLKLIVFVLLEELGESGLLEVLRGHVVSGER